MRWPCVARRGGSLRGRQEENPHRPAADAVTSGHQTEREAGMRDRCRVGASGGGPVPQPRAGRWAATRSSVTPAGGGTPCCGPLKAQEELIDKQSTISKNILSRTSASKKRQEPLPNPPRPWSPVPSRRPSRTSHLPARQPYARAPAACLCCQRWPPQPHPRWCPPPCRRWRPLCHRRLRRRRPVASAPSPLSPAVAPLPPQSGGGVAGSRKWSSLRPPVSSRLACPTSSAHQ